MLSLDLPLSSGTAENQTCFYLSIRGLIAAEMQVVHKNQLGMPCIARVALIMKALGIPEDYQKWSSSDSKLLLFLSIYHISRAPTSELMQLSWFFWDVAEINFAHLTLVFLSKPCWNILVLCIFLSQGKHTRPVPLCVTILTYQPLLFSPGSLWRAWKSVTAHWLAMWLILGLVKIWCKQILTQCWMLFLPVHAVLGTLQLSRIDQDIRIL